ncbi:MAG TPA: ABC transporter ATP-binding protein [Candidatus Dormibacteraeota bacterium]
MASSEAVTAAHSDSLPHDVRLVAHEIRFRRRHHEILKGISLELEPGRCLGIAGPNAAGKSTLLGTLAGWLHPSEGHVELNGRHLHGGVPPEVGFAAQEVSVYPHLTGRENLKLFGELYDLDRQPLERRIDELVDRFELEPWIDHEAVHYSGGVARRLHLCIALINSPQVLLLDEPTTGLDPSSRRNLLGNVVDLLQDGVSVVMTSQLLGDLEVVAHRLMVIVDGRRELYADTDELVAQLGAATLYVELAQHHGNGVDLDGVPGVISWKVEPNAVIARLADTVAPLHAVLERLARRGLHAARIEVQPPSLEQMLKELVPDL